MHHGIGPQRHVTRAVHRGAHLGRLATRNGSGSTATASARSSPTTPWSSPCCPSAGSGSTVMRTASLVSEYRASPLNNENAVRTA